MSDTDSPRLLDCGHCFEEQGEEVHPHPECPIGQVASVARYRRRTAEIEAVQWTGSNTAQLRTFCGTDFDTIDPEDRIEDGDQDAQVLVQASHWTGISPGRWVLKFEDHLDVERDEAFRAGYEPAVSSVGQAPTPDRTALRDRIRRVLCERDGQAALWGTDMLEPDEYGADADAVLAVLPEPTDRTTVRAEAFDEAADKLASLPPAKAVLAGESAWKTAAGVVRHMAVQERRMAAGCPQCGDAGACNGGPCPLTAAPAAVVSGRTADETQDETPDTLPAWLYQRFMADGEGWTNLDDDQRAYWEHQAAAVRRAVARGGFRPAAGDPQQPKVIRCDIAISTRQPHAPHDWTQRPDGPTRRCPGTNLQQPTEARP
jgi:hypothetical protein